jgi:hypothetical protein
MFVTVGHRVSQQVTSSSKMLVEHGTLGTGQYNDFIGLSRSKYVQKHVCTRENTERALCRVAESNRHWLVVGHVTMGFKL